MISTQQRNLPFVLFQIREGLYAISSTVVREVVGIPRVISVPQAPPEVRGVISLRGEVLKLVDLRIKLGLGPLKAELEGLVQLLNEREQDHRNWLTELESCVKEHRAFKLARNPHKCKFGLWYDAFKSKDRLLEMTLPAMDAPHQAIHATADAALRRAETGDFQGAMDLIKERRHFELAGLIKLFEESRRVLVEEQHEVAIVLSRGAERLAFAVDTVESVELIPEERIEPMPAALAGLGAKLDCSMGRRLKSDQTILILSENSLFSAPRLN